MTHSNLIFICKQLYIFYTLISFILFEFSFILSAIQNALRQGNLNPEIEEKLLNLQRCHEKQMKGVQRPTSVALANNHHEYTSPVKYSSSSRKHAANRSLDNDAEWIMETPKRRPPRTTSFSEKGKAQNAAVVENDVNRIIRSVAEETGGGTGVGGSGSASGVTPTIKTPIKSEPRTPLKKQQIASTPVKRTVPTPLKSTIATVETKPVNNVAATEISPNRRLAQTKKDNEKKKQMQVSNG